MNKTERVLGIVYIPFHAAVLPLLMLIVFAIFEIDITGPSEMLVYYTVSFILVVALLFRFLRTSFSDMIDEFWRAVQALVLAYVFYLVLSWAAVWLMGRTMTGMNPNSEAIVTEIAANFRVMVVVTVVLAPIVEETVFRGALFGTIRQKSRIAAYIVSVLLFGAFHLWEHLVFDFSLKSLLFIIQYVPPSIALAWCYERSGTIWSPILLHALLNLQATFQAR